MPGQTSNEHCGVITVHQECFDVTGAPGHPLAHSILLRARNDSAERFLTEWVDLVRREPAMEYKRIGNYIDRSGVGFSLFGMFPLPTLYQEGSVAYAICYFDAVQPFGPEAAERILRKCMEPGCPNRSDQGEFEGLFCASCYAYHSGDPHGPSQAERNALAGGSPVFNYVQERLEKLREVLDALRHLRRVNEGYWVIEIELQGDMLMMNSKLLGGTYSIPLGPVVDGRIHAGPDFSMSIDEIVGRYGSGRK